MPVIVFIFALGLINTISHAKDDEILNRVQQLKEIRTERNEGRRPSSSGGQNG